jgi:hypothetical protein
MGRRADSAARVTRDTEPQHGSIRPAERSGLFTLARSKREEPDAFEGLDRLDRAELDEADAETTTPRSWRHPLSRRFR